MANRNATVPRFGNWENDSSVPYTACFDKARKGRGGKLINPNDPQENPDLYSDGKPQVPAPAPAPPSRMKVESEIPSAEGAVKPKHSRHSSKEDGVIKGLTDSPARHDSTGRKAASDPSHQRQGDRVPSTRDAARRAGRQSAGSDQSIENSPSHPHHPARTGGRGGGSGSGSGHASPAWEKKTPEGSHGLGSNTPGRSRFARGDQTPERGAAVPKFGEWDESDPASADGFTHIFNQKRIEKQSGSVEVPIMPTNTHSNAHKQDNEASMVCFCFPWGKK